MRIQTAHLLYAANTLQQAADLIRRFPFNEECMAAVSAEERGKLMAYLQISREKLEGAIQDALPVLEVADGQ